MVKVFISHQYSDSMIAQQIAHRLRYNHHIDSYLDVIDPTSRRNGEDLAEYIRTQLSTCSQLLAVVSNNTKDSWWVPWEIGVATEKEQPLATYAGGYAQLPEYLRKWPYLRSDADLDQYAHASKAYDSNVEIRKRYSASTAQKTSVADFYKSLRANLGQNFAA